MIVIQFIVYGAIFFGICYLITAAKNGTFSTKELDKRAKAGTLKDGRPAEDLIGTTKTGAIFTRTQRHYKPKS